MNRTDLLNLAKEIAIVAPDDAAIDRYLDDVLEECARYSKPPQIAIALQALTSGTHTYTPTANAIRILHAFYHNKHLSLTDHRELEAYSDSWRTDVGSPWAITYDEQSGSDYRLYPIPSASSAAFAFPYGAPLGRDYPNYAAALIYGDKRSTDIPDYFGLPIALLALAKEFSRPSSHRDKAFADICQSLAELIFALTGVEL